MEMREQLAKIVKTENVIDDLGIIKTYSSDLSYAKPMVPFAVVKPKSHKEVKEIVRWANETTTTLIPVSSGPPHHRGDTVPSVPGAVVVDMSGMKNIISIDRRNKLAIIEPGVTWSELQPELKKEGMNIPMPLLPREAKSVIGSLLEREPITIPKYHWTLLEPLRCCNVIWGNGEEMWTGEAGDQKGTLKERWENYLYQVSPLGPHQTDFYRLLSASQGSMGIVTSASVKCEVTPKLHKLFFIQSNKLEELIDIAYKLTRYRYGYELFILNRENIIQILGSGSKADAIPAWMIVVSIAGLDYFPEEQFRYQKNDITEIVKGFGHQLVPSSKGSLIEKMEKYLIKQSEIPNWKLNKKGGYEDVLFVSTLDKVPQLVKKVMSIAMKNEYELSDIGIYIQPMMQGVSCHCEIRLPYEPENQDEKAKVIKFITDGSKELMEQGAYFSRPYGVWSDMVYGSDYQTTSVLKKVKGIFDPNNIMNTGKLCF